LKVDIEMDNRQDANLLVGYFSLDGSFSQLVGVGLLSWGLSKKWKPFLSGS